MPTFEDLAPWLLGTLLISPAAARAVRGSAGMALAAAVAAAAFAPLPGGVNLSGLMLSVTSILSVPTALLLAAAIVRYWHRIVWFSNRDLRPYYAFNVALGVAVYASTLGFFDFDVYDDGYRFSWLFICLAAATIAFAAAANRTCLLLLFAISAWLVRLLPTPNVVDYFLDVPLFIFSAAMTGKFMLNAMRSRKTKAQNSKAAVVADSA